MAILCKWKLLRCSSLGSWNPGRVHSYFVININYPCERLQPSLDYSTNSAASESIKKESGTSTLAKKLAILVEESSNIMEKRPKNRMELKRSFEHRIKKRVKEHYVNGRFQDLMKKVVSDPETLLDAYNCIRLNSNVDISLGYDRNFFETLAEELCMGSFDVNANTFSISTRGQRKETLVLPSLRLKVVQEAIRIVLEVVYRPHFSKISHGCRSGRGHSMALKYISKEISNPDWWFTMNVNKKLDACILDRLFSVMEEKIEDPGLFAIIRCMFDFQVLNLEFGGFPKGHGLPQEGILSPILMNIYLDLFDREFYRLSMKYEAINLGYDNDQDKISSNLRSWFRRQLKGNDAKCIDENTSCTRVYCCRFMDEIFFAVSSSKESALSLKSEMEGYLKNSLLLDLDNHTDILPCDGHHGIRYLGVLVRKRVKDIPAVKSVHKLKEKVHLFASQKQEAWNSFTVRVGKKWLGHGLKKVKESEIKHLADSSSVLSQISSFRKPGMETDHWYKFLVKIWMQDVCAMEAKNEEIFLSRYIVEPSLPRELKDSFYEFQTQAEQYNSSETASVLSLLPNYRCSRESLTVTEIIAPIDNIKKRLLRYGLTTFDGYPRFADLLVLQDGVEIIDWFSGIIRRWLVWYENCDNFNEIKVLISNQVRKSCIRTLAAKYRVHETEIEKRFDSELSRIPSIPEIESDHVMETVDATAFDNDEALTYGIFYSGVCMLSLARIVSESRPCNCFVMACLVPAQTVYTLHVMERQKFPGWKTGFSACIHPSLNRRKIGLCKQHLRDLYLGRISLQTVEFGAWSKSSQLPPNDCEQPDKLPKV